ncbi:MAG: hypothetical protein K9M45_10905 [Kiritimatiellales bacterium]|nr:hypothetical protein [Kiritimatiellales bacterium]
MARNPKKTTLKHRMHVMQAEAASISIAIHLLFILLAGSIVAVRWINKEAAEFAGDHVDRPKLERRQLQMPVKVKNMQKKSRRPQVKTRMSTAAKTAFRVPDMMKARGLDDSVSFNEDYDTSTGTRDLSGLGAAGNLGFGISGVNFFGIKSSGEKLVFIVEDSKRMLEDKKGGFTTYKYVKKRLHEMVDGMKAATLFNVMLYDSDRNRHFVKMFSQKLIAATDANRDELNKWFVPINNDPKSTGHTRKEKNYTPRTEYDSFIGTDTKWWLTPVQAAMEQGADTIFILGSGWGSHELSDKRRLKLYGDSRENEHKWLISHGWTDERIKQRDADYKAVMDRAKKMLGKENEARKAKGLPPKFVRHMHEYARELGMQIPEAPPSSPARQKARRPYTFDNVTDHIKAAYTYNYIPKKMPRPQIHFVYLIPSDYKAGTTGGGGEIERVKYLRVMTRDYRGRFEYLRGSKTMKNLLKYNPALLE